MPFEIALALGRALTGLGTMAARAAFHDLSGGGVELVPPPGRSLLQRVWDRVTRRCPDLLATTREPAAAARLLDTGWAVQAQAVLVLSSLGDATPALEALRWRHDWRDFAMRPPVEAWSHRPSMAPARCSPPLRKASCPRFWPRWNGNSAAPGFSSMDSGRTATDPGAEA